MKFSPSSTPFASEADAVAGVALTGQKELPVVGTGAGGFTTTLAVANFVVSATLVARTVNVCCVVTDGGAVYRPVDEIDPTAEDNDQVTAVLDVALTVAVNCCVALGASVTFPGETATATVAGGATLIVAVFIVEFSDAETCTEVGAVAELICTANWALVAPAGTVTLEGADTVIPVAVHPIETTDPPEGAGPESATVHCDEPGVVTELGLHDKLLTETDEGGGMIVTVAPVPVDVSAAPDPATAVVFTT